MKTLALRGLVVLACAGATHASLLYQFNLTGIQTFEGNQLNPLSFSFTVPTFVVNGDTPSFSPFTVTDTAMNMWTMTDDVVGVSQGTGCFTFKNASAMFEGGCGFSVPAPGTNEAGAFFLELVPRGTPLPTAVGVYSVSGNGIFNIAPGQTFPQNFGALSGTLEIAGTVVPEPASTALIGIGLMGILCAVRGNPRSHRSLP